MIINGFLVVRLPPLYEIAPAVLLPAVNEVFYAGVDRGSWDDVFDETYIAKKAPPRIAAMAEKIQSDCIDRSGIRLTDDFDVARELLIYSNRNGRANEMIAIRSGPLNEQKGSFNTEVTIDWLGLDVFLDGHFSMLAYGLFAEPVYFREWATRINANGLFDRSEDAADYEQAYKDAEAVGRVEELADPSHGFRVLQVEVGRVIAD